MANDRDWVNSPKHKLRQEIEAQETEAIAVILSHDRKKFAKAMLRLSELYDEDK